MNLLRKLSLIACIATAATVMAQNVEITTPGMSMLLQAKQGENLKFIYFGNKLAAADAEVVRATEDARYDAYPTYGLDCSREAALAATFADGNMSLDLRLPTLPPKRLPTSPSPASRCATRCILSPWLCAIRLTAPWI